MKKKKRDHIYLINGKQAAPELSKFINDKLDAQEKELNFKTSLLKKRLDENQIIINQLKKLLHQSQNIIDQKQQKIEALSRQIEKLSYQLDSYQEGIERYKELDNYEDDEEITLYGEMFEVSNQEKWEIKDNKEIKGPFAFSEIIELKELKKIDSSTLIRSLEDRKFKQLHEIYEFNTQTFQINDQFYIKRLDFRAPFHGAASLEINGHQLSGYCTNLSVGGCFIELGKIDNGILSKGDTGHIIIKSDVFEQELRIDVTIRNVREKRPRGIGFEFNEIETSLREEIHQFIQKFEAHKKKAA